MVIEGLAAGTVQYQGEPGLLVPVLGISERAGARWLATSDLGRESVVWGVWVGESLAI